jgi:hypothetical protein
MDASSGVVMRLRELQEFTHPKLLDRVDSKTLVNEYIIQFNNATTKDEMTRVINSSGGNNITFVYEDVFKGAAVANVTNDVMTRILDDTKVIAATHVRSQNMMQCLVAQTYLLYKLI